MDKLEYQRGSFTIEASMIFSVIVLAVIALLFSFSYMQQKTCVDSAASYAAQQGAELWLDSRKDLDSGRINAAMEEDPLGYRIFDNLLLSERTYEGYILQKQITSSKAKSVMMMMSDNSLPGRKAKLIGEALCSKLEGCVIKPESTKVRISYSNSLFRGRISIEIIQEIKVPLGGVKKFFSGKDTVTLMSRSDSLVSEPDEFIRNVDLAVELAKKLEGKLDVGGVMERIVGKGQK